MFLISLWLGKVSQVITRFKGGRGSALPGYIIERINSNFLKKSLSKLSHGVIVISGTNGKTTTTKLIAESLESLGFKVLTNKTGSNFVRGVISLIVSEMSWLGKLDKNIAILEQDEAYAVHFATQFPPRGVVVLNVMRDQMDRFGEIDNTARLLNKLTSSAKDFVVLNGDDSRVSKLTSASSVKKVTFGTSQKVAHLFIEDDDWHEKSNKKIVTKKQASHDAILMDISRGEIKLKYNQDKLTAKPKVTGLHNYINFVSAFLAVRQIAENDIANTEIVESLSVVEPAFGRGEVVDIDSDRKVRLQLVKNPSGFTQSLKILEMEVYSSVAIAINDQYADGRDVSWLWDVDFHDQLSDRDDKVLVAGSRRHDMALRLKYDEVDSKAIDDFEVLVNGIKDDLDESETAIIFCTYTCMLEIRKIFEKQGYVGMVR